MVFDTSKLHPSLPAKPESSLSTSTSVPTSNAPSNSTSTPATSSKRPSRRERKRAKRASGNGTPVASGSSTPLREKEREGEFKIKGKGVKDQEGKAGGPLPVGSGNSGTNGGVNLEGGAGPSPKPKSTTTAFGEGEDFIPFAFSDSSDDEAGPSTKDKTKDRKGKGKEIESADRDKDRDEQKDATAPPLSERAEDKSKANAKDPEREWDRGKARADDDDDVSDGEMDRRRNGNQSHKRKYRDFDPDDGYANKKQRMDAASRKCPWVEGLDLERCQNVAEMLHKEVDAFVDWISPTPVEDEIRGLVVAHITRVVTAAFPDASVYPFGSFQTKLYLPLGDIDLVILSDQMAYSKKETVLQLLANVLKRAGITSHVTIIARAKVPIVKFTTTHGRFKVDISINHANGLVSGKIITGFLRDLIPNPRGSGKESKALRSLVMITKAFLSQRSMNEVYTGGLGSYSIVCLAVSFLQMHPKIRRGEIDPEENLGVLAMEFFELYGHHFNYDEVGISLREGGMYFSKRQRGWHAEYKRNMLSIEDPADPSNDISSGSYNFHKVRTAFAGCHGILTSTAYLRAGILSSRRHGRSVNLRGHYEPEDLSILATVMGITQETINHRRLVQELYDRRVLHNILGVNPLPESISFYPHSEKRDRQSRNDPQNYTQEASSSSRSNAHRDVIESVYDHDHDHDRKRKRGRDRGRDRDRDDRREDRYDDYDDYDYDFEADYRPRESSRHQVHHRDSHSKSSRDHHQRDHHHRDSHHHRDRDRDWDRDHHRDDDIEEGRYDIGRQPPKKRRRTGRAEEDSRTVFVADEDEDDGEEERYERMEDEAYRSDEGASAGEGGRGGGGGGGGSSGRRDGDRERQDDGRREDRRSYWLSKATPAMADPMGDSS